MTTKQVHEFNTTFGVRMRENVSGAPESVTATVRIPEARLRFGLIKEELQEYLDAVEDCDIVELLDALGDIEYVVDGAALVFGLTGAMTQRFEELFYSKYPMADSLILDENRVQSVVSGLRVAILRNDAEGVGEWLGIAKAFVYNTAKFFDVYVPSAVDAIHESNMSKLGEDGKPIYREEDRKVLKGPNYKTPTDDLCRQLFGEFYAPASE